MKMTLIITSIVLLVLSAIGFWYGLSADNIWLIQWSPEVGGASIVTLGIVLMSKVMKP